MRTIVFANPKGGVGKSTLYDEVAWALEQRGVRVTTYQLDNQSSAYHGTNEVEDADYALVDTPARPDADTVAAINSADLVVVPVGPSPRDLAPTAHFVSQVTAPIGIVLNEHSPSRRASQDLEQFAREREWNILGKVPTAVAFKNTPEPPSGVVTHSSSSPAAHAIRYLTDQIVEATK